MLHSNVGYLEGERLVIGRIVLFMLVLVVVLVPVVLSGLEVTRVVVVPLWNGTGILV